MKNRSLIISLILNFIIALIKFISGMIFNMSSLFADGIHTLSDFISNIFSIISDNIAKKRSNKKHPFGYGMIQYIFNFIIGIIIFLVGVFIFTKSFHVASSIPSYSVAYIISICFIIKTFSILKLYNEAIKTNNRTLLVQTEASKTDLYSSVLVFFITLLLQFSKYFENLKYLDNLGSLIISLMIFKTSYIIIKENFIYLLGINEIDDNKYKIVNKIINEYKNIELKNVEFIGHGPYYIVDLDLLMDSNIPLKKVNRIEKNITRKLKLSSLKIKYVHINSMPKE